MKKPVIWFLFFTFSIAFDSFSKVVQPPCNDTLVLSAITTNESCSGDDGVIDIQIDGGLAPFNYFIPSMLNGVSNNNSFLIDSLIGGSYSIIVTDSNNCTDSINVEVISDSIPNIILSVEATNIVCHEDTNGTFKVVQPDSSYSYVLYRYTLFNPQVIVDTGFYFNELIKGYYGVIAISPSGNCVDSSVILFIDEPEPIIFNTPTVSAAYCTNNNICEGLMAMNGIPTGGVSPFQYYLNELYSNIPQGLSAINDTFQGLCPGIYETQVVDANACVAKDTVEVADSSLYIDSFNISNISCFGFSDGEVTVFAHGGRGNNSTYSYYWTNTSTTQTTDSLNPGFHTVSITDSVSCIAIDSVFIIQPDTLLFKIIESGKIPESCMGVTYNGEIILEITGGTFPYTHSWISNAGLSGNGTGDTLINLTYDTITISITDSEGCVGSPSWGTIDMTIVDALNASDPIELDSVYLLNTPLCYNSANGTIIIAIANGNSPFQYSIDNGNTQSFSDTYYNVSANTYNIVIYDVFGCSDTSQITVNQFDELVVNIDSIKNISCYDGDDGYIALNVSGGISPYNYLWIPTNETSSVVNNLVAIPHTVQITDSTGCFITDTITLTELSGPLQSSDFLINDANCFGSSDGSALVYINGGMPNSVGEYQVSWINANNDTIANGAYAEGLSSGSYLVSITDSFSCGPFIDTLVILQPDLFYLELINILDNLCFNGMNGEINVNAFGGTKPYNKYFISDSSSFVGVEITSFYDSLYSSSYTIWALDNNGCNSDTIFDINLGEPGKITAESLVNDLSCHQSSDGFINLTLSSGTSPYVYQFYADQFLVASGNAIQQNVVYFYDLSADNYSLHVTDYYDCEMDTQIIVNQPQQVVSFFESGSVLGREEFEISFNNLSSGSDFFVWDFDDGISEQIEFNGQVSHTFIEQGQYTVMLVAENINLTSLCNDTSFVIIDIEGYDLYNVFSPNNDGINDFFQFDDWMLNGMDVEIFNRWGQKVYHWNKENGDWDGRGYNGEKLSDGTYFYTMSATGSDGYNFNEKGTITILR
jgi:gliding motility-associated-like protein